MKKRFFHFKYKLILTMCLLIILPLSLIVIAQYKINMKNMKRDQIEMVSLLQKRVIESINATDLAYYVLEKKMEETMKTMTNQTVLAYSKQRTFSNEALEGLVRNSNGVEINIISRNNQIVYSSNKRNLSFNYKLWPELLSTIEQVKKTEGFESDRLSLSVLSNKLMKYSYQTTLDKRYVVSIGIDPNLYSDIVKELNFTNAANKIKSTSAFIDAVTLYNFKGKAFDKKSPDGSSVWINYRNKGYFLKAIKTMEPVEFEGIYKGKQVVYVYIANTPMYSSTIVPPNVIEIIFNKDTLNSNIATNRNLSTSMIILAIVMTIAIGFGASMYITRPLNEITEIVRSYSKGNFYKKLNIDTNDEFGRVSRDINTMAVNIQNLMDESGSLYEETLAMNEQLNALYDELKHNYLITVKALANSIEASDKYTRGHCERVTHFSMKIAEAMQLSADNLLALEFAALLHDIGKIGIPSTIIGKTDKLTKEEYEIIKKHPEIGMEILKDVGFLEKSTQIIYQHHERYDGKGYPNGLQAEQIDLSARILNVADAYDAMTSDRPYRQLALTKQQAMEEIIRNKGIQFDPQISECFLALLEQEEVE